MALPNFRYLAFWLDMGWLDPTANIMPVVPIGQVVRRWMGRSLKVTARQEPSARQRPRSPRAPHLPRKYASSIRSLAWRDVRAKWFRQRTPLPWLELPPLPPRCADRDFFPMRLVRRRGSAPGLG